MTGCENVGICEQCGAEAGPLHLCDVLAQSALEPRTPSALDRLAELVGG